MVTTCKYDIMVLSFETSNDGITYDITRTHGNFRDTIPRCSTTRMITCVDHSKSSPIIAIKCYDGLLKTIPVNSDSKQLNMATIR